MDRLESEAISPMKKCYFCQGTVRGERITHIHRWGEQVIILEDVPADVCRQCGEVYFAPGTLKAMDQLVEDRQKEKPKRELRVPVHSFSQL